MKRAKIFMSAAVMSSFVFACSFSLFADDQTVQTIDKQPVLINQNGSVVESKTDLQIEFKKMEVDLQEYIDDNNRFLGNYPVIKGNIALSEKIHSDIDTAVRDLDIDVEENITDDVIKFNIDENEKLASISVVVRYNDNGSSFYYYLNKETMKEILVSEYEKGQRDMAGKAEETEKFEQHEITMVPLRTNAENLGWAVEWRRKSGDVPARAILTKGKQKRAVFYNSTLDYDFVITENIDEKDITTGKLDRNAELIDDSVLFVPSSFIDKFLKSDEASEASSSEVKDNSQLQEQAENKNIKN